jgi:hypothetical protein
MMPEYVSRIDERLEEEVEALLSARRHENMVGVPRGARPGEPARDLRAKLRQPVRVRVLPELPLRARALRKESRESLVGEEPVVGREPREIGDDRLASGRQLRFGDTGDRR